MVLMLGRSLTITRIAHARVAAGEIHLHVVEKARIPELAHVPGDALGGERLANAGAGQVGADIVRRDASVADDLHVEDGLPTHQLGLGGSDPRRGIEARSDRSGRRGSGSGRSGLRRRLGACRLREREPRRTEQQGHQGHDQREGAQPSKTRRKTPLR
jgi:hypothetical protein